MATLKDFKVQDYLTLLGSETVDLVDAAEAAQGGTLKPNTRNRTIFVGLGGTGVKAINRIKRVLRTRMAPGWNRYVGFLAIDTDANELKRASELLPMETLNITKKGATERYRRRDTYSKAAKQFMPDGFPNPDDAPNLGDLMADGSNQQRLVGKVKLHDCAGGAGMGNDEEIVHRLDMLTTDAYMDPIIADNSRYEVFVLGSGSGGTCSGSFNELPALIRHALRHKAKGNLNVHGILFLPDTVVGLAPNAKRRLEANGYGTLKELNYFQGMPMRKDYKESFPFNGSPDQIEISEFYSIPYLVGNTAGGGGAAAIRAARESVSEFLLSLLAEISSADDSDMFLTDSFISNSGADHWTRAMDNGVAYDKEANGTFHNFPRGFSAMGFARATGQEKLLRTYQVAVACERAAMGTVSKEKREAMKDHNPAVPPFRAADDYFTAAQLNSYVAEITEPLTRLLDEVYSGHFSLSQTDGDNLATYEDAQAYSRENVEAVADAALKEQTGSNAQTALAAAVADAFKRYRQNVISFVKVHGPLAFVNVYRGSAITNEGSTEKPIGIEQKLKWLMEGRDMAGNERVVRSIAEANRTRQNTQEELDNTPNSVANRIKNSLNGYLDDIKGAWVTAIDEWIIARINAKRKEMAFGTNGIISRELVERAATMTDKLMTFGHLLDALSSVYAKGGDTVRSFEKFQTAKESDADVNMAAMQYSAYAWLKQKADNAIAGVEGLDIRNKVIDDFFGMEHGKPNWDIWLSVPDTVAILEGSSMKLQSDEVAIPARARFDQLVTGTLAAPVSVSIRELFLKMAEKGSYESVAASIIGKLRAASAPRCTIDGSFTIHSFILYPADLGAGEGGDEIVKALREAAGDGVGFYATADADGLMYYQHATNFALHQIRAMRDWEMSYNNNIEMPNEYLHSKSPCTRKVNDNGVYRYIEPIAWRDYPDLMAREDPEQMDDAGEVCREGQLRGQVRELIAEARKLGVLYAEKGKDGKFLIYRVHCDRLNKEWNFDVSNCTTNDRGLYPLGKALAEAVAEQNGRTLGNKPKTMSRAVTLEFGGVLSTGHADEKQAWEYAVRVLRDHVPMFLEVKDTVENYFRGWAQDIIAFNEAVMQTYRPAMMEDLLLYGALYCKNGDQWMVRLPSGTEKLVANLSTTALRMSRDGAGIMVKNNMLGYYLFTKIDALFPEEKLREACDAAHAYVEAYSADMTALQPKLDAGAEWVEKICQEREFHISKHCREYVAMEEIGTQPSPLYVDFLNSILRYDARKATPVELFYSRVMPIDDVGTIFL